MKSKKITKEGYLKEFCLDLRLRKRKAVYIRSDIHERMEHVAHSLKGYNISLSALVTMILVRHINAYWPIHDQLAEEATKTLATPQAGKAKGDRVISTGKKGGSDGK
ncbi:MAG: DUF3408 domain-containing protein [Alistipes sp.]|nr:DUF3408 domain-containing protein [Alistipes sp.]